MELLNLPFHSNLTNNNFIYKFWQNCSLLYSIKPKKIIYNK